MAVIIIFDLCILHSKFSNFVSNICANMLILKKK
jgi:hypothetical protein